MPISLVLDVIISVLLVLTIAYAVRLNQRLAQLRSDKNELMKLAKTFAEATTRAEAGISQLKISSEALSSEIKRAEALKDDLAYLVNRGNRAADDMVETARAPKRSEAAPVSEPARRSAPQGTRPRPVDEQSRLIEEAIRAATPTKREDNALRAEDIGLRTVTKRPADERGGLTRRITGHAAARGGSLASRGLGVAEPEDGIEDTQAARELLKALSAVK